MLSRLKIAIRDKNAACHISHFVPLYIDEKNLLHDTLRTAGFDTNIRAFQLLELINLMQQTECIT